MNPAALEATLNARPHASDLRDVQEQIEQIISALRELERQVYVLESRLT